VPATDPEADPVQRVTDYLAGMTDRFCLATYEALAARQ
jgi:dGTP triphosphohydrolase